MPANAAYISDIEVSDDDTTYEVVGGANDASANLSRAMLDVTEYGDEAIKRIAGLFDSPMSVSGHRIAADAGQALIVAAFFAGTPLYVRYKPDGSTGFKVQCLVENFPLGGGVADTATFSASLVSIAKPVAV